MFIDSIETLSLGADIPFDVFLAEYHIDNYRPELYASETVEPLRNFDKCVKKRQAEYLAGRCCAKRALESLGTVNFDILSAQDRSPIWPEGIAGSITHTTRFAAAAVNFTELCRGIGIDLEKVFDAQRSKLRGHICSASEIAYLESLPPKIELDTLFTLAFSAKESLYKALYPIIKVFFYFDSVEVESIDVSKKVIRLCVTKGIGDKILVGTEFDCHYQQIDKDYLLTYCVIV